jgi:hypothetical protein
MYLIIVAVMFGILMLGIMMTALGLWIDHLRERTWTQPQTAWAQRDSNP